MPKLINQAFFPCNPHTDVHTAMHYTATATTSAAQSCLGSSMLLGGKQDKSALLTEQRSSSNVRLCQRETSPPHSAAKAQDSVCTPSNHGFPLKCQRPPGTARVLQAPRFQQSLGWAGYRFTPGTWQVGWGGVSCPHLPCTRTSSCRRQPLALLAGRGCPGGARLSAGVWQSFV